MLRCKETHALSCDVPPITKIRQRVFRRLDPCVPMKLLRDCFGHAVRLTDERLAHIMEHAELAGMEDDIERVLEKPSQVNRSRSDDDVKLFYEFYARTRVGGKWFCVVVKYLPNDAFVITEYLTDTVKAGELLWPKS